MMGPMTPAARSALAAAIVVPVLSSAIAGCGLFDGSAPLEEALEYLPAGTDRVRFVDRARAAERLKVDDVDADSSAELIEDYLTAMTDAGIGTSLSIWTIPMTDAAFNEFAVEWEAVLTGEESVTIWKTSDDLDLEEVGDDLVEAGYEEGGSDDAPTYAADVDDVDESTGLIGGRYPSVMLDVTLVPDEHLVIAGALGEDVAAVALDEDDSMADDGGFGDLVDEAEAIDDVEFASLAIGDGACAERRGATAEALGDLGRPEGVAVFASGSERPLRTVLRFASDEAAATDAEARASYLDDFNEAYGLSVDFEVEADGSEVVVEAPTDELDFLVQALASDDGPVACGLEE